MPALSLPWQSLRDRTLPLWRTRERPPGLPGFSTVVSKVIDNKCVIFFEGATDSSGVIERIVLPAPKLNTDNLTAPKSTTYDIKATYEPDNLNDIYRVNIYDNIYVIQTINVVPSLNVMAGDGRWQ